MGSAKSAVAATGKAPGNAPFPAAIDVSPVMSIHPEFEGAASLRAAPLALLAGPETCGPTASRPKGRRAVDRRDLVSMCPSRRLPLGRTFGAGRGVAVTQWSASRAPSRSLDLWSKSPSGRCLDLERDLTNDERDKIH